MSATLPAIQSFLDSGGLPYEILPCDPELADTAIFCEHYGIALEYSANAILVRSKTGERKFVVCVLLATARLNTNHTVRKKMRARKVSFASADETRAITGMEIGGNRSCKIKLDPQALLQQANVEVVSGLAQSA